MTQSTSEKKKHKCSEKYKHIKKIRRLFILYQIMFCINKNSYTPFHVLTADLIDCYGGSSELIRVFNRLGVCTSYDTLLRQIHESVEASRSQGIIQGLVPSVITLFSMDYIDFLKSHAQVYKGNQQLTWHGTTIQAVQPLPSLNTEVSELLHSRRRPHTELSPFPSPDHPTRSPLPKRFHGRPRTAVEFSGVESSNESVPVYNFEKIPVLSEIQLQHPTLDTSFKQICFTLH